MRYGVIGAGVLGLTTALRLAERGHDVTVMERGPVPGGLAASFEIEPGVWLERFYHHLFASDRRAIGLIEEVGLGPRLRWHAPETTLTVDGRPRRLDSPTSLLRFDALGVRDRLRMGATIAFLKLLPSPQPLAARTADAWMRSMAGSAAADTIWSPLLKGKFGAAYERVTMAWLWARIHDRTTKLGYLAGGFHQFYSALADRVEAKGGSITYGANVTMIAADGAGVAIGVDSARERALTFDRVVSTLPPALNARLASGLGADYVARHPSPAALSAHCLILALDRPLTGIYWIGVGEAESPFLAVVEHTAMVNPSEYGGRHLLYLGAYRTNDDPISTMSLEAQLEVATALLRTLNPTFDPAWVTASWTFHAPFAQPIVDTGFAASIPGFDTPIPNFYVANMFQVYPHDRGQNYSIELAERLVSHLEPA